MIPELSICIGIFNRWEIFQKGYSALADSILAVGIGLELVIADFTIGGCPAWIDDECGESFEIVVCNNSGKKFTRGGARNAAAITAKADNLFFMDADMILIPAVLRRGLEVIKDGKAFFPYYDRITPDGLSTEIGIGTGNVFCSKAAYESAGRFPEIDGWGKEDTLFSHWFKERGLMVREKFPGFLHQYHKG